jgi:hypothetical protein
MNDYRVIGRFYSNGVRMITILMNKAACTMSEREFNSFIGRWELRNYENI